MSDVFRDQDGLYNSLATFALEGKTIVFDRTENRQVMWLDGVLPLPPGSLIELYDEHRQIHGEATVQRVRLTAAAGTVGAQVCLDCVVTGWWERQDGPSDR